MNKAHQFATHGFSHDGLKALFKYFKDEYYADYFELDPTWISRDFMEYKNMNTYIIIASPFVYANIGTSKPRINGV
jgi:hypothetical protein